MPLRLCASRLQVGSRRGRYLLTDVGTIQLLLGPLDLLLRQGLVILGPLELALDAPSVGHFALVDLSVLEDDDSPSLHLSLAEGALVPDSVAEDDEPVALELVVPELSVVLKFIILKDSLFPFAFRELPLKEVVWAVFLAETVESSIFEMSTIVRLIVFDCQSWSVGHVVVKDAEEDLVLVEVLPVALLLLVSVQSASKDGLPLVVYPGCLDVLLVHFPKVIELIDEFQVGYVQVFLEVRQPALAGTAR